MTKNAINYGKYYFYHYKLLEIIHTTTIKTMGKILEVQILLPL